MLTGLVVGKFCPLHRGHEALIAFAAAGCDRLVILSYTSPELGYPTEDFTCACARKRWRSAVNRRALTCSSARKLRGSDALLLGQLSPAIKPHRRQRT